jgi:hypothetical protein
LNLLQPLTSVPFRVGETQGATIKPTLCCNMSLRRRLMLGHQWQP